MSYAVKEIFRTLQGEGAHTGRVAIFCRFSGCNLWNGREQDRATSPCNFCDTDFVGMNGQGGGRFATAADLADAVDREWSSAHGQKYVVCTGGEPLLQLDEGLIDEFHKRGFEVAVETNGTVPAPVGLDWICVSPKAGTDVVLRHGSELKVVYPQSALDPADVEDWGFTHFFLQPMDSPDQAENLKLATSYCLQNPKWRLSLQTHKLIGIP
jgi:7-carboxy-7-deazaguanine synthase (Cx14CxxC type)